jgi:hypothetical protein
MQDLLDVLMVLEANVHFIAEGFNHGEKIINRQARGLFSYRRI